MNNKKQKRTHRQPPSCQGSTLQQQERLAWALNEWDCRTLEEAKKEAATDSILHRILRECGVDMEV